MENSPQATSLSLPDQIKALKTENEQLKQLNKYSSWALVAILLLLPMFAYTAYKYYDQGNWVNDEKAQTQKMLIEDEKVREEIKKSGKAAVSIQGLQLIQGLTYFCKYNISLELYICSIFDTGHDGEEWGVRRDNTVLLKLVYRTLMRTRIKATASNSSWGFNEDAASDDEATHQYYYGYFYYIPEY